MNFENLAAEIHVKQAGEVRHVSIGFLEKLGAGELLSSGTPLVSELGYGAHDAKEPAVLGTADLSFLSVEVNAVEISIKGQAHPPGTAVQFRVGAGVAGRLYWLRAQKGSTAGQTLIVDARLAVV